jgi:predicted Zn-dependent protease
MSPKIWKELLVLVAIFGAIWAGLSYYSYEVDADPFSISLKNEEALAEFLNEFMLQDLLFVENEQLDSALGVIFDRLISNMDTVTYDYQLHVIRDDQVNAFTSLNGNIYVFTGLIKTLENPEELAVILAHEIGHAERKHVVEKLVTALGMETLFVILAGGDPLLISEVAKLAISTSFDRHNEEEADDFALNLALKSKINPRRLGQFFLKLKGKESNFLDDLEFLRTHPLDNDRIKKSAEFEIPKGFIETPINVNWKEFQEIL